MSEKDKKGSALLILLAILAVIAVAVIVVGLWVWSSYNGLVTNDLNTQNAWANVQTAYQRRADLIPNLVQTAKGYSNYEGATQTQIAALRSGIQNAKNPGDLDKVGGQMDSLISNLIVSVEAYPQLQASQNYLALQDELAGTENRINFERNNYNDAVKTYQYSVRRFPSNIIAGIFGFNLDKWSMFQASTNAQNAPIVNFSQ